MPALLPQLLPVSVSAALWPDRPAALPEKGPPEKASVEADTTVQGGGGDPELLFRGRLFRGKRFFCHGAGAGKSLWENELFNKDCLAQFCSFFVLSFEY